MKEGFHLGKSGCWNRTGSQASGLGCEGRVFSHGIGAGPRLGPVALAHLLGCDHRGRCRELGPGSGTTTAHSVEDRAAKSFTLIGWKQWGEKGHHKRLPGHRTCWNKGHAPHGARPLPGAVRCRQIDVSRFSHFRSGVTEAYMRPAYGSGP